MTIKNARCVPLLCLFVSAPALAMLEPLSEGDMQSVSGQDGIEIGVSSPGITATSYQWTMDKGTGFQSNLKWEGLSLRNVGLAGASPGVGNFTSNWTLDVGDNAQGAGGNPHLMIDGSWSRARFQITDGRVGSSTSSLGTVVLDTPGTFRLINRGIFDVNSTDARLLLQMNGGDLWYRQGAAGSPELLMDNIRFTWDMPTATVAVNPQGLLIQGVGTTNFDLRFDLRYEAAPTVATAFQVGALTTDLPMLHYGWLGDLNNVQLQVKPGGSWQESVTSGAAPNQIFDRTTGKTQGITSSIHWDYGSNYVWEVGEIGGVNATLQFGNWQKLPTDAFGSTYAFDLPTVVFDVLNTAGQGPGGLCWGANWDGPASSCAAAVHGGQYINVPNEANGIAWLMRDGQLRAYSTTVKLIDTVTTTYNWGLIYTMGNFDGNIYAYPGNSGGAGTTGLKLDLMFTSQSFDYYDADGDGNTFELGKNWKQGGALMIADTTANMAIGFRNISMLLAANDLYVNLLPASASFPQGGINLATTQARIGLKGRFGGGDIPNLNEPVDGFDLNANLEFSNFSLTLSPSPAGQYYLGYDVQMAFANTNFTDFSESTANDSTDDGTFIGFSETSKPSVEIRLADIRGNLHVRGGQIDLQGDAETPSNIPARLIISNFLDVGPSATSGGSPLVINRVELKNNSLGSIVIPDGQWYSKIALQPKN